MKKIFNIKENYFYYFIFLYSLIGVYLSLNVGITHDEGHSSWVWELNRQKFSNIFFNTNYDVSQLDTYHGFYGIGFYIFSSTGRLLINKHPVVFIFFYNFWHIFKKNYLFNNQK